nr:putative ribonuclease H-like domain-containing protein [Tanacetum cinerariifolium]
MYYLSDFEELNGGYVAFGGNPKGGKITGKGKIKTENQLILKVKVIRSDNGTEFKNSGLNQFCGLQGIKREFSVPKTPQQNGIAERKNRTLIEAARTMLADSLLPIPFWAEAVNTACYVQNRVLVTKPHNKTPYELLHGTGPTWLFDIDSLTRTVNYHPVTIGNQHNFGAGFQDKFDAEKAGEEVDQSCSSGLRRFFRYAMLSIHSIYVMSLYPFTERYAQPYFFSCFIRQRGVTIINELRFKIQELHREIIQIIRTLPTTQHFSSISQKEAEMKNLKNQLQDLERQHKQKRIIFLIDDPWRLPSTPFVGISFDPQPLPQSYTHTTSPSLNIWASEQRRVKPPARKEPTSLQESQSIADIKCKDKSSCDCTHTKKKFHSKRFSGLFGKPWFSRRSIKKWKFIRKKMQCGKTSDRCFIYKKRGHFSRNFLDKKRSQALIQALNQVEPFDVSYLESLYSLDDEPRDSVLCTITYSDLSSDDDSDTYSPESDSDFGVHMINPIPHVLPIQEDPPLPLAKIYLLTDAYAKPILVIAFFDTGSSVSILNPNILPDHYWKPHRQNFMAANGENFVIDKISVILIFGCFQNSHAELLSKFYSLVTKYGIILSAKKMKVGMTTIQFLAMKISDGKYQPQPHVAQELLKFSDELSS